MLHPHILASIVISVPAFAIAGAVTRYNLRLTETRWQIAAFVGLAISGELIAGLAGANRASVIRGTLNAAAAALVIISVKFHLEPAARKHDSAVVRRAVKKVFTKTERSFAASRDRDEVK